MLHGNKRTYFPSEQIESDMRCLRIRIYPDKNQDQILTRMFGIYRLVYNKAIEDRHYFDS